MYLLLYRNDAEPLEEIIKLVLKRLIKHHVNTKGLIGIDKAIAHLEPLLHQESEKVRVIGIWGMRGIGKTTIVEEIFNQICCEFRSKNLTPIQTMMCGAKESGNQYQGNNKQSTMINNKT